MFTGIIRELGTIAAIRRSGNGVTVLIHAPRATRLLRPGSSVCLNGVCVTVVKKTRASFTANLMPTTLKVSGLSTLERGKKVNVEPSVRAGDELGGHFLMGHVDGTGRVTKLRKRGMDVLMTITLPHEHRRYVVSKGPIAVEGVSLTVKAVRSGGFDVALIPYTLRHTTLGRKSVGESVNLEVDLVAKYLEQFGRRSRKPEKP